MLTAARVLQSMRHEPAAVPAAPHRPRNTCFAHVSYVAGCTDCREAHAAYKRWQRKQRAYGRFVPFVNANPARRHLREVMDYYGLSAQQIAPHVGVSGWSLSNIANGVVSQIRPEHAEAVLAVTPLWIIRHDPDLTGSVTSLGTSRRLQALMAIGYGAADLVDPVGSPSLSITHWRLRRCPTIAVRFYRQVRAVYTVLHARPGPSLDAAVQARNLRYPPPICWDDDDHIDNPPGRPRQYDAWVRLHPDPRALAGAV